MFSKDPPMLKDLFLVGSAGGQHYRIHRAYSFAEYLFVDLWARGVAGAEAAGGMAEALLGRDGISAAV